MTRLVEEGLPQGVGLAESEGRAAVGAPMQGGHPGLRIDISYAHRLGFANGPFCYMHSILTPINTIS